MKVFSRKRIGLRAPRGSVSAGKIRVASIHHAGRVGQAPRRFKDAAARWRSFQAYHMDSNGWQDIGYNFGIDRLGRLYEGRPVGVLPSAVGGHNSNSIAFCFMQDGDAHGLSWQQRRTLKQLFKKGLPSHGVPPLRTLTVKGHNEFSGHEWNACPGRKILKHLRWRRAQKNL